MEVAGRRKANGTEMRKVEIVYYLSRNGHLEHPHFMEIYLPLGQGLYLRDVIKSLDNLRGKGMAKMYSWSSKRSYKNGYVWQDLTETDFIYPIHGNEYILKGTELFKHAISSPNGKRTTRRSFDFNEYKDWKTKTYVIEEDTEEEQNSTEITLNEIYLLPRSSSSSNGTHVSQTDAEKNSGHGGSLLSKKVKNPVDFMQFISRKLKFRQSHSISTDEIKCDKKIIKEECLNENEKCESFTKIHGLRKSQSCKAERQTRH